MRLGLGPSWGQRPYFSTEKQYKHMASEVRKWDWIERYKPNECKTIPLYLHIGVICIHMYYVTLKGQSMWTLNVNFFEKTTMLPFIIWA